MKPSYVGVQGVTNDTYATSFDTVINSAEYAASACCGQGGTHSTLGVLIPNGKLNFSAITDGSANTVLISEVSDFIFNSDNVTKLDRHPAVNHGWIIGANNANSVGGNDRTFNCITVRFLINQKRNWGSDGGSGIGQNSPINTPLTSAHPGGVNAAIADGSVTFLNSSIPFEIVARLVSRNEGLVASTNN
jgi:hypothetical protein